MAWGWCTGLCCCQVSGLDEKGRVGGDRNTVLVQGSGIVVVVVFFLLAKIRVSQPALTCTTCARTTLYCEVVLHFMVDAARPYASGGERQHSG